MSGSIAMITIEEALHFVQDVLGMSSPSSKLKASPINFLDDLIQAWLHHIPWQSVKCIATPPHLRHIPTQEEIKKDVTTAIGGLCYHHNNFCCLVLRALGFDVSLAPCDVKRASDHVGVIVHNMTKEGSKHYVDVGITSPFFHPIPLDFQDESPEYHDSFLRYKFSRQGDVIYLLTKVEGNPGRHAMKASGFEIIDGWFLFITIHSEVRVEISHFTPSITPIYTIVGHLPFLSSLRCMAYPNGRFVCIIDTTLLLENEPGCISKSYFRSRDEIKVAFARYFPQFPEALLNDALNDENVKLDYEKGKKKRVYMNSPF